MVYYIATRSPSEGVKEATITIPFSPSSFTPSDPFLSPYHKKKSIIILHYGDSGFLHPFQDGYIDFKVLAKVLSPESEIIEVS